METPWVGAINPRAVQCGAGCGRGGDMEVTEVRIHLRNEARLKAFATVTFDGAFAVHNMKVVKGNNGLIVCMPSRKIKDGTYKDIAHPINNKFRSRLEGIILKAYKEETAKSGIGTPALENHPPEADAGMPRADRVAH